MTDSQIYGKDCPAGKVQIEFVGVSPALRQSDYSWRPSDNAFLEIYIDGVRFRVDVGNFQGADGSQRRGLHIIGPLNLQVDHHSSNAVDIFFAPPA